MSNHRPSAWCPLQQLSFQVGKPVGVPLRNLLSAGYVWSVDFPDFLGSTEISAQKTSAAFDGIVGAGPDLMLNIEPKRKGTGLLKLVLKRPFESSPTEVHVWTVEVFP